MNQRPFIYDVVIPTYNRPQELLDTVKSIINQTLPPARLIIVNDGSSKSYDASRAALEELLGTTTIQLQWIDLERNAGVSSARNHGLDAASANIVAFNDDDDFWIADKAQRMASVFAADPTLDAVFHSIASSQGISELRDSTPVRKITLWQMVFRNPLPIQAMFARHRALSNLRFDTTLSHSEDYDFLLQLVARGANIIKIRDVLSRRGRDICSPGGLSESRLKMRLGELQAKRKLAAHSESLSHRLIAHIMITLSTIKVALAKLSLCAYRYSPRNTGKAK